MFRTGLAWVLLVLALGCGRKSPYEGRSVAELERMLASPEPAVQARGALGLGLHGEKARPAVPALVRALQAPDALVRQQAAAALGQIGAAEEAVPALAAALGDSEWAVRHQSALALGKMGPLARPAEPALRNCEQDGNALVRKAAAAALTLIGGTTGGKR